MYPMSFDNPNDPSKDANKTISASTGPMGNILNIFGLKKPTLRLVKTLNRTTAKIIPFKQPLVLIVGGFVLSIYALV